MSGLRSLVLISDTSSTLDALPNLLNPSTGPTFICCKSIQLGRNIQSKAVDLFCHLSGIALVFLHLLVFYSFSANDKSIETQASGIFSPTVRDGMTTRIVIISQ